MEQKKRNRATFIIMPLIAILLLAWMSVMNRRQDALVVYCAHDLVFAESVLKDFETETGIKIVIVGDTEATKSLGLVKRLIAEKYTSKCDVFWNNQVLGTMQLADEGILSPYQGPGFQRIPERYKHPDGLWTGFAGRLRVNIINTDKLDPEDDAAIESLFTADDRSRVTIANPIYGTTLTHVSTQWKANGAEATKIWHQLMQDHGMKVVQGNATVKNLVAEGICDIGWTDTDDFFVAVDDNKPVAMKPIRIQDKTICIPNSVAIIQGTKQRTKAEKLVDYLLSKEVELRLAKGRARQIPLGEFDESELPEDVRPLYQMAKDSWDVRTLSSARKECLEWLFQREHSPGTE